jgi:hypothetical protein
MYTINSEKVLFTQLGDEGVLYHIEKNEYFNTNETFTKIILGLENNLSLDQIVENLMTDFEVDKETCQNSVEKALKILEEKGFIE